MGQNAPQTHGEFIRVIFESLALKYREVLDVFRELSVNPIEKLHIIGGGSRNKLLNRFTSNAIGLPVWPDRARHLQLEISCFRLKQPE